ncbi:MAG: hypothetical protein QOF70_5803 [Acetobacteraceae bacterium]|jgi:hypothetical protein|nr:hypothetical protein [Rhodopila sp.]MEA2731328.1 hypothetical protein [Acetobacteraceae bacterium]
MRDEDESPGLMTLLGPSAFVAVCVVVLHILPTQVLTFLTAWTLASFPIGVLIGHCVLSEE